MYVEFNGSAKGPLWGVNTVQVAYSDAGETYTLQIFPDICNDDLKNSGKPMHFYIMPNSVRMARNDDGKYQFHFTKFSGILTEDSNIGTKGQEEVAGGMVSFTSTLELPPGVIDNLKDQIAQQIKKNASLNSHPLFMFKNPDAPAFELGFVPVEENIVAISTASLNEINDPAKQQEDSDKWLWEMQGDGKGSLDPNGKNACTAMMGQFPAALVEAGFKGDSGPLFVQNALKLRFYIPSIEIKVVADYSKIHSAYATNSKYKDNWTQSNIHSMFEENNLSGFCKTIITYGDAELTDKDKELYNDMAAQGKALIMENVKKFIFDRQPVQLAPAEAAETKSRQLEIQSHRSSSWLGLVKSSSTTYSWKDSDNGYSYALNQNFSADTVHMEDSTVIQGPYFKTTVVSGNMRGFFQELSKDPKAKDEYFSFVNMGDAFKKIHVIATSRANWPTETIQQPLDKLLLSVGYRDSNGVVQYRNSGRYYDTLAGKLSEDFAPAIWTKDNKDRVYVFDFAVDDNVPADKRNQISIKRTITYKEDERVKIDDDNTVEIPEETTTNTQVEIKADLVGHLKVAPIYLAADLNKHMQVEVTFNKDGFSPSTIMFTADNATEKPSFEIWTADAGQVMKWSYKVKVTYKSYGPLDAIIYEGDEVAMSGSYPNGISINLPKMPDGLLDRLTEYKQKSKQLDELDA
ncbi:hypothetical protein [Mucilaginibacter sp.]|uniref:hypothetical protein n=1 Tax=Mucilaginibacter sp. TaxID=1882438 RepID=UPI00326540B7